MGIFLLIVAGLVAWFFIAAMSKANRRMAYADQKEAERELKAVEDDPQMMPTWLLKPGQFRDFWMRVAQELTDRQVPQPFAERMFNNDLEYHRIMHLVALLERRNGGFKAQVNAAADYVFDKWVTQEYHKVGLPTWGRSKPDVDKFVTDVSVALKTRSVAPPFFKAQMEDTGAIEEMMGAVTEAERVGASREDQVVVAAEIITDHWEALPQEDQDRLWAQDFKDVMRAASEATKNLRAMVAKSTST